jgi:diguanylate cyclase (GGDEF)-like protein/PAS domain S-box-containing protein
MTDQTRYEYIINRSNDFVSLINRDYVYEFANDAYCEAVGMQRDQIVGKNVEDVWGEQRFHTRLKSLLDRCFAGESVEYVDNVPLGSIEKQMHVTYQPYDESDETTHALVLAHDITRLAEIETKLTHYEYLDPLTGLFNRRSLDIVLDKEIFASQRSRIPLTHALLFISLRGFTEIHRSFGVEFADILLENTGLRVRSIVRESDYVFRFDGTELTVLLTNITRAEDSAIVAEKVHDAITLPYKHNGIEIAVSALIGIAVFPTDGTTSSDLIRNASSAVLEAEKRGVPYCLYEKNLHEEAIARVTLKSELVKAFEERQFVLHYQPLVDTDGMTVGAEALIRWNHPHRGLLLPDAFIGLAEETRLISAIDKWALYEVCRQLSAWSDYPEFFISINISARDLLDEYIVEVVRLALQRAPGLSPSRLKLELTERISMNDPERSIRTMQALNEAGVDIWIDDFGTGQSSLAYLKQLPGQVLKIDKVFIDQIANDEEDLIYLESIVRAIKSRGKQVLVEGVSHEDQTRRLRTIQCDLMQGYYFSRPVGAERLMEIVQARRPLPHDE